MTIPINLGTAIVVLGLHAGLAHAQTCVAPANEECSGAIEFGFADLPLTIEGVLGCENDMVDRPYFDLFYRYDCTVTGNYMFDMCGSLGDTYMRVYTGGCGFFTAASWVEDDDSCVGSPNPIDPMIVTRLEAGESYWIEVGSWRVDSHFPPNANDPFELHAEYLGACLADLTRDGIINFDDLDAFVNAFISFDLLADLDGNGTLNFDDIDAFVTIFLDGCK